MITSASKARDCSLLKEPKDIPLGDILRCRGARSEQAEHEPFPESGHGAFHMQV
jgi:hypothetical protein